MPPPTGSGQPALGSRLASRTGVSCPKQSSRPARNCGVSSRPARNCGVSSQRRCVARLMVDSPDSGRDAGLVGMAARLAWLAWPDSSARPGSRGLAVLPGWLGGPGWLGRLAGRLRVCRPLSSRLARPEPRAPVRRWLAIALSRACRPSREPRLACRLLDGRLARPDAVPSASRLSGGRHGCHVDPRGFRVSWAPARMSSPARHPKPACHSSATAHLTRPRQLN